MYAVSLSTLQGDLRTQNFSLAPKVTSQLTSQKCQAVGGMARSVRTLSCASRLPSAAPNPSVSLTTESKLLTGLGAQRAVDGLGASLPIGNSKVASTASHLGPNSNL